jgi:tRNA uridine 5-carboxymethylaminomethyl modification enzyme
MESFILVKKQFGGGRVAEKAATGITEQLVALGFESDRFKNRNSS